MPSPAATPSWKLVSRPRSKHEKRTIAAHRNLNSFCYWQCMLCLCRMRKKFLNGSWNCTILLCMTSIILEAELNGTELNWTAWPQSVSELYRSSDRRFSAKLVATFADSSRLLVSVTDPHGLIFGFLDRYLRSYDVNILQLHKCIHSDPVEVVNVWFNVKWSHYDLGFESHSVHWCLSAFFCVFFAVCCDRADPPYKES
jgi:hypothetical protein